jgi:hypothetical protein
MSDKKKRPFTKQDFERVFWAVVLSSEVGFEEGGREAIASNIESRSRR